MYDRDPRCVYVADNLALGQLVVAWLGSHDIPAEAMNELTLGGFEGLVAILPEKLSFRGIEIWVRNPADVDRARQLIAEHEQELKALKSERAAATGTVEAVCEECGQSSTFPASEKGTVQSCPHCDAYLDVPDPDEPWDGTDAEREPE